MPHILTAPRSLARVSHASFRDLQRPVRIDCGLRKGKSLSHVDSDTDDGSGWVRWAASSGRCCGVFKAKVKKHNGGGTPGSGHEG
jgi:hypothetical protein